VKVLRKTEIFYLILLIAVVGYANFCTDSFTFEPVYFQYPDAGEQYVYHNLFDSTLLADDPFTILILEHINNITLTRVFIRLKIYLFLMLFFPLSFVLKLASMILCVFSVILIFKTVRYLYSKSFSYVTSGVFLIYFLSMDTFYGGQDRSFGAFIFLIFMFFLVKEKFMYLPFVLTVISFFYPQILFLVTIICLLVPFFYNRKIKIKWYLLILIINLAISILFLLVDRENSIVLENLSLLRSYKYVVDIANTVNMHNPIDILRYFILNFNEHSRLYIIFTNFFIIASLFIVFFRKAASLRMPKAIWLMLLGSILGFIMVYPVNSVLASRQFMFTLPLFLVFFVTINISSIIERFKIKSFLLLMPIVLIFVVLHPFYNNANLNYKKYKPLYDYIDHLPKSVVIAGFPNSQFIESIPLFSKRQIFHADGMDDISIMTYGGTGFKTRRKDLILALYASSLKKIKDFVCQYSIDYFVIEDYMYKDGVINSYKRPSFPRMEEGYSIIANDISKNYFLSGFIKENYNFKQEIDRGAVYIVDTRRLLGNSDE